MQSIVGYNLECDKVESYLIEFGNDALEMIKQVHTQNKIKQKNEGIKEADDYKTKLKYKEEDFKLD